MCRHMQTLHPLNNFISLLAKLTVMAMLAGTGIYERLQLCGMAIGKRLREKQPCGNVLAISIQAALAKRG